MPKKHACNSSVKMKKTSEYLFDKKQL